MRSETVITGVIGSDTHIVGSRIVEFALRGAGFHVVGLGALTQATEFVEAAIETAADAILVSSMYGQGELDCADFPSMCREAGVNALLYVGGNLVVGSMPWPDVERTYLGMGFDRVFPPRTRPADFLPILIDDLSDRASPRASG